MKVWLAIAIALLLLVLSCPLAAAPQPYVPQAGDLHPKDQPSAGTIKQVDRRSEVYRPAPYNPNAPLGNYGTRPPAAPPAVTALPRVAPLAPPAPALPATAPPALGAKPAPVAAPASAPVPNNAAQEQIEALMRQALQAYAAKDCAGFLQAFHPQAYVLVRNPWGEHGILGHQQLRDAYCADLRSPAAPTLQMQSSKVEVTRADRAKVWGRLGWQGQRGSGPVSFEADLLRESGVWLVTDAIIQYDVP